MENIKVGDKVSCPNVSAASTLLYKSMRKELPSLECPCHFDSTVRFIVAEKLSTYYLLQVENTTTFTVLKKSDVVLV